jgi:PEP-CTERM motif
MCMSIRSNFTCMAAAAASLLATASAFAADIGGPLDGPPNLIPEPGTWALMGVAIAAAAWASRGKRK